MLNFEQCLKNATELLKLVDELKHGRQLIGWNLMADLDEYAKLMDFINRFLMFLDGLECTMVILCQI